MKKSLDRYCFACNRAPVLSVVLVCTFVFACVTSAQGATEAQLKARLQALKAQTASAGRAYDKAYHRVEAVEDDIKATRNKISKTKKTLARNRKKLNITAVDMYRGNGAAGVMEMLLAAESFESLIATFEYTDRIGKKYSTTITKTVALQQRLNAQKKSLQAKRDVRAKELKPYRAKLNTLNAELKKKEAQFKRIQKELAVARAARNSAAGVSSGGAVNVSVGSNGMVFPVVGSYYFSDTYGAARSGGRRHQGTDVMARRGTPLVAITSGTVRSHSNGLGGRCVYLTGSNGWTAYYAHMNSISRSSGHVNAGDVIGTVGDTGNARGTPHLHIQLWNHGRLVNPYRFLRAME